MYVLVLLCVLLVCTAVALSGVCARVCVCVRFGHCTVEYLDE